MPTALIIATSPALGHALAAVLRGRGWAVRACSRRGCDLPGVRDCRWGLIREILDPAAYTRLYPSAAQAQPR